LNQPRTPRNSSETALLQHLDMYITEEILAACADAAKVGDPHAIGCISELERRFGVPAPEPAFRSGERNLMTAILYQVTGSEIPVTPPRWRALFSLAELQAFVGGYIQKLPFTWQRSHDSYSSRRGKARLTHQFTGNGNDEGCSRPGELHH